MKKKFWQILFTAGLIVSFSAGAFFVIFSDASQLVKIVPDDAFYYFKIAQNIIEGFGSTFDGTNLANGYHPLWMVMILPLARFIKDPLIYLKSILILELVFRLATVVLLFKILEKITKKGWLVFFGACFYFLNPQIVSSSFNGLETGTNTFLFAVLIYFVFFKKLKAWILGLILGLFFLARTDNIFYIVGFCLLLLSFRPNEPQSIGTSAQTFLHRQGNFFYSLNFRLKEGLSNKFLLVLIFFLITISPWLLWHYLNFGTVIQTSADAVPMVLRSNYLLDHTVREMFVRNLKAMISFPIWGWYAFLGVSEHFLWFLSVASFLILAVCWKFKQTKEERMIFIRFIPLFLATLSLAWIHDCWRHYPRDWHFDTTIFLMGIVFTLVIQFVVKIIQSKRFNLRLRNFISVFFFMFLALMFFQFLKQGVKDLQIGDYNYQNQPELLEAAYWLKCNLKEGERVGAFNAGIMSFFSGKQVVNLDGVINNNAYKAVKSKSIYSFIKEQKIDYYLDLQPYMNDLYSSFFGERAVVKMNLVAEIDRPDVNWENSHIKIYKLRW